MPKRILIVEDDDSLRRIYIRLLGGIGHVLTLARGADEGKALLLSGTYDLLITDYELGDGKGTEVIEAASHILDGGGSIIIISGSLGRTELESLAERYRLTACFSKPLDLETLLATVNRTLS